MEFSTNEGKALTAWAPSRHKLTVYRFCNHCEDANVHAIECG